jgi:UDP-GlcNAc:undecaprenyl-phosphate GlcNAc-1-phosphate transferase
MMIELFFIFLIPLILSLIITPFVIKLAKGIGAIDQPNERKVHKLPIPRLGGVAIYFSFFLSLLLYTVVNPTAHPFSTMDPHLAAMLVVSLSIVLALGIWDDIKPLSPGKKFLGQFLAATIVYIAGFRLSTITHPLSTELLDLGIFNFPATIIWIVGITNAFNLIDGLDGLAGGVAFIVSLTICTISFLKGDLTTAMMALLLAGAVLGFLRYNFSNARIFLGDSGSLFIGFMLAILSMLSSTKGSAAFSIIVPVLALGLPIMDTLLSMMRRLVRSIFPEKQERKSLVRKLLTLFLPDRGHIHHQLMARGLSHRSVVLLLYVVSVLFGIGSFALTATKNIGATSILFMIGVAMFIGVSQLRYREMAVLRNGILLPMYEWPLMNSGVFQGFLDILYITGAYAGAHLLVNRSAGLEAFDKPFIDNLLLVAGIQFAVFYVGGLYKGTFKQLGIADAIRIFKIVISAILVTWMVIEIFSPSGYSISAAVIFLDFYILLSFVLGARASYNVLNFLSREEKNGQREKVLIYGADAKGALISQHLVQDGELNLWPVGFLDDDPRLEHKHLNGYPIFGSHWKIERLVQTLGVKEILISTDSLKEETIRRLGNIARLRRITLKKLKVQLEEVGATEVSSRNAQERFDFVENRDIIKS